MNRSQLRRITRESYYVMLRRCYDPTHMKYSTYGARGVTVCDRWRESVQNFIEDMGLRPGNEYTIDRNDNSKGYSKENCRWSTHFRQALNRDYGEDQGVSYKTRDGKWMAYIQLGGKTIHLGTFKEKETAKKVRGAADKVIHRLMEMEIIV